MSHSFNLTAAQAELRDELNLGHRVAAVKIIRTLLNCGLKEAVDIHRVLAHEPQPEPERPNFNTDHIVVYTADDGFGDEDRTVIDFPSRGRALDYAQDVAHGNVKSIIVAKVVARSERITTIKIVD